MTIRIGTKEFGTTASMSAVDITRVQEFWDREYNLEAIRVHFNLRTATGNGNEFYIDFKKDHPDSQRILSGQVKRLYVTISIQPPIEEE